MKYVRKEAAPLPFHGRDALVGWFLPDNGMLVGCQSCWLLGRERNVEDPSLNHLCTNGNLVPLELLVVSTDHLISQNEKHM
jgi:hypothetical protein